FLLMESLGGFAQSSAVIIWSALCPLAALLFEELRRTIWWLAGFVALLFVSSLLDPFLPPGNLTPEFLNWFFALNIGAVISIAFSMLFYFVGQRDFFQERSEMLLL